MIWKWVQELVSKLSFITRVTKNKSHVFLHYFNLAGEEKYRKIPFRANKNKLLKVLEEIKEEIEYNPKPMNYIPAGFAFTDPDYEGENNE